jgi:hypothetical protein
VSDAVPFLDIETAARRVGALRWVELRLFEVLGRWSAVVPEPAVKAVVGTHSHHAAWRAELWRTCLPALPSLTPDSVTVPPSAAVAAVVDAVDDPGDDAGTLGPLTGVYRVLVPHLLGAGNDLVEVASPVGDAPLLRVAHLVRADLAADRAAGERLIRRGLLRTGDDARRAAARQGELEANLVDGGGLGWTASHL